MAQGEVMNLTTVCGSFPELPSSQIYRENILDTIDTIFEGDTQLVAIEGREGLGKTTLLAQFAKKYPNHTFSLFIKPTSRWTYDSQFLLFDLCNQINWKLHQEELHEWSQVDDGFLRISISHLHRLTRQHPLYFLIDGLEDIPEQESRAQEAIRDALPFGLSGFRFLLTGDLQHLKSLIPSDIHTKSFPLPNFTLDETIKYMENSTEDRVAIEEIYRTCRGVPGFLASIQRIVHAGTPLHQLLEELPSKLPQLFEIEWRTIRIEDVSLTSLLAIVAHSLTRHTIKDLARITSLSIDQARKLLQEVGFVVISLQNDEVSFVSEAFRKFAADRLSHLKDQVNTQLIDDLLHRPDTNEALTYLPGYLIASGRYDELLTYLLPDDHFMKIVEQNQSLGPIRQRTELGISTAVQLNRDQDLIRFCIQCATIDDFEHAEVWRSEVEARMALRDYDAALSLAQGTKIKEDRLHLLAVIAKIKLEQNLPLEPELLDQMRRLYTQIDLSSLDEKRAIDIASDLLYSLPDLAIELVEKATLADTDTSARDWAFAQLTIAAFNVEQETVPLEGMLENLQSRIENPSARRLSLATTFLFREASAREVLAEVAALDTTDRLNLLRLWAVANRTRRDAIDVVDAALKLMIQTTDYSPNARVLRELATPLPYTLNTSRVKQLVGTLDSQKDAIEALGPTDDYVRLQLLLARTESAYGDDFETVRSRFIEIYFYICDIDDLALKTLCTARLADILAQVDPKRTLEAKDRIHSSVQQDLQQYLQQLLLVTADHYQATKGILHALAKTYPDQAISLALALNIEPRRDQALADIISSAIQAPIQNIDWHFIDKLLQNIVNKDVFDQSLLDICNEFSELSSLQENELTLLLPFLARAEKIQIAEMRCKACGLAFTILTKHDNAAVYNSLASRLMENANTAWEAIDEGWKRVNAGFAFAKVLADVSPQHAKAWIEQTDAFKNQLLLEVPTAAASYLFCLNLAIRAYSGLLIKNLVQESDQGHLADYIDQVPSRSIRAKLWAELAMRYSIYHHIDECKRIVNEHVRPLLEDINVSDVGAYHATLPVVAPAFYKANPFNAFELIARLPQPHRDAAYLNICNFILQKVPPSEPYEERWEHDYQISYDDVIELCNLLTHMEIDISISSIIGNIGNSVIAARQKNLLSKQQLRSITEHLKHIINTKLPNPTYIHHDGYVIISLAQVARIERAKQDVWSSLIENARKIPNLSDKALVLAFLAINMPKEATQLRYKEILQEAGELIKAIPAHLEKMERFHHLATIALYIDNAIAKQYIDAALSCTPNYAQPIMHRTQRHLIDLAYRLDPAYAALLASRWDDDPARNELKQRVSILEAKKYMEHAAQPNVKEAHAVEDIAKAAWMSLGALNASRINPMHMENMREFILAAAKHPLEETYPILAWAIENAIKRFGHTDQAKTYLKPIYLATLLGVELAGKMAMHSSAQFRRRKGYTSKASTDSPSIIIRSGNRETALQMLSDWFEHEVKDYLIICDPFFGPNDLEILKLLHAVNPSCKVQILTSKKHQMTLDISSALDEIYRKHWFLKISDQNPPPTEIIVVGTQNKHDAPIHDRWWLTQGGGLRLGTSFNFLGITKVSEISKFSPQEAEACEKEINQYIQRPLKQEHKGERLLYTFFNL